MRGLDHDDPRLLAVQADLLRRKPFLRRWYARQYGLLAAGLRGAPAGPVLELGSGAGFLKDVVPGAVTSDIAPAPGVDRVMPADRLDVPDGSLAGLVMLNVFHHVSDPRAFLREAARALQPGGRVVMIEPAHSPVWSWLARTFSPEPYDARAPEWGFAGGGRLSGANVPQAWIVFVRDRARFDAEFPALRLVDPVRIRPPLLFLLSGGTWYRGLMPGWSFRFWEGVEAALAPLRALLGAEMTVILERR